jgi:hypothetical protein
MRPIRVGVFLLLFLESTFLLAQTRREDEPYCGGKGSKRVEIADADATILDLEIGRSTLKDAQAKLGEAKISRVSHEEESDISICYISPTDGTVLILYSGVMGGGTDITWFGLWSSQAKFPHVSECTASKLISRHLTTGSGLGLGVTREKLTRQLGTPAHSDNTSVKYEYLCRSKMTDAEIKRFKCVNNWDVTSDPYFDRMSWIETRFTNSRSSLVEVGRIESY